MTYSIVARDPESGALGVAVHSHYFAIGAVVPWVEAGVGAVATQAFAELSYGPLGLERMRAGESGHASRSPRSCRGRSRAGDPPGRNGRPRGRRGRAHRLGAASSTRAHRQGAGWSVQGNMMRDPTVPDAMAEAFMGTRATSSSGCSRRSTPRRPRAATSVASSRR